MEAERNALVVADKLIRLSLEEETPLTPMQVQKLTYFCHAWMLGLGYGPMFLDAVESWQFGPVIRDVYHALKQYGGNHITQPIFRVAEDTFTDVEQAIINVVWQRYGHLDGPTLSSMTHAPDSPWHQTYQRDRRSQIIHNHVIRDYYAKLIADRRSS